MSRRLEFSNVPRPLRAVLLAAALTSMGSTGAMAQPQFSGTIQIMNSSAERLRVLVDGMFLGAAAPSWNTSFTAIAGGQRSLLLTTEGGMVRASAPVFVPGNGMLTFSVSAAPPPIAAIVYPASALEAAATSSLRVANRLGEPMKIILAGRLLNILEPGQVAVYHNLRAGLQIFQAKQMNDNEVRRQDLDLVPGVRMYLVLASSAGTLRLANTRAEPVVVFVDNAQSFPVAPGATIEIPNVLPGQRTLSVRVDGVEQLQAVINVYPGRVSSWVVRATSGKIRVINRMPEPILVTVDGTPQPNPLMPGRERYLTGVPPGVHKLAATNLDGAVRNLRELALTPGETRLRVLEL